MNLQFVITDYTHLYSGQPTITTITEPVGWDKIRFHLKRDEIFRGFFSLVDDSLGRLQFNGNSGGNILRAAYRSEGVGGLVILTVSYQCNPGDVWTVLYTGQFDFTDYTEINTDSCYVECHVTNAPDLVKLNNRNDQECDLDLLASYDQLPVQQTINTSAIFLPTGSDGTPNQIQVGQLLNGLKQGSKITFAGTTSNNRSYTVASAVPNFQNVQESAPTTGPSSSFVGCGNIQITGLNIGGKVYATLVLQGLIYGIPNDGSGTLNLAGSNFIGNNTLWTVINYTRSFNYTMFYIEVNYDGTALHYGTDSGTGFTIGAGGSPFNLVEPNTSTIITVAENITLEDAATCSLTAIFLQNNLVAYNGLNKIVSIQGKTVQEISLWEATFPDLNPLYGPTAPQWQADPAGQTQDVMITPAWAEIQSEIDETSVGTGLPNYGTIDTVPPDQAIFWRQTSIPCSGPAVFNIYVKGGVGDSGAGPAGWTIKAPTLDNHGGPPTPAAIQLVVIRDIEWNPGGITSYKFNGVSGKDPSNRVLINQSITLVQFRAGYTAQWSFAEGTINPGDFVWVFFYIQMINPRQASFPVLAFDIGSTYSLTLQETCAATPASVYMVNEVLSRCAEYYTNGNIQVYSDYFGRPDAQPQPSAAIGCGALEAVTNGLKIRGAIVGNNSSIPKTVTSLKAMFDGLNAIHNIGMALENDPTRPGFSRLRIEPIDYFFQNTNLLTCLAIGGEDTATGYERTVDLQYLFSLFNVGYKQFQTWNNNGLYDLYGSRVYRTPLTQLKNTYDRTCDFIASDYAIEFTRRMWGLSTSDGRYDSELFILCLSDKSTQDVLFTAGAGVLLLGLDLISNPGFLWAIGQAVTITNAGTNSNAGHITNIQTGIWLGVQWTFIQFDFAVTFAVDSGAIITANTVAFQADWIFMGATGVALLSEQLYDIQNGDVINIQGTGINDGNFPLTGIGVVDSTLGPLAINAFVLSSSTAFNTEDAPQATITDITHPLYLTEQGMPSGTNEINPATVLNYRISPAHNALRHFKTLAMSFRQFINAALLFVSGEGNIYALGGLTDDCALESGLIGEGADLTIANFKHETDAEPLYYAELVKFEYPLSYEQYLTIANNPYGLIGFQHLNGPVNYGWIEDLQYSPYDGMGYFTLRPKALDTGL